MSIEVEIGEKQDWSKKRIGELGLDRRFRKVNDEKKGILMGRHWQKGNGV